LNAKPSGRQINQDEVRYYEWCLSDAALHEERPEWMVSESDAGQSGVNASSDSSQGFHAAVTVASSSAEQPAATTDRTAPGLCPEAVGSGAGSSGDANGATGSTESPTLPPDTTALETDRYNSGLSIKRKWLDLILSGQKTWEIRGTRTKKREVIALIESGSGLVLGEARIADSLLLSSSDLRNNVDKHRIEDLSNIKYDKAYAWVLTDAKRHKDPQPYEHPQGAVSWINLAKRSA
jgi:hypothetical protein